MKKQLFGIPVLILVTVILVIMVYMFNRDTDKKEPQEGDLFLYYVSAEGYSFEKIPYQFVNKEYEGAEQARILLEPLLSDTRIHTSDLLSELNFFKMDAEELIKSTKSAESIQKLEEALKKR